MAHTRTEPRPLLAALALLASACTYPMYAGPLRPAHEIAKVEVVDAKIVTIDGKSAPGSLIARPTFELLPGDHTLGMRLSVSENHFFYVMHRSSGVVTVCFMARAGRVYSTGALVDEQSWQPQIVDNRTGAAVQTACAGRGNAALASSAADPESPGAPSDDQTGAARPPAAGHLPQAQVHDREIPPRRDAAPPPALRPRRPGSGFGFELGGFFGGDELITVQLDNGNTRRVTAGAGIFGSFGGMWTPLWLGGWFGLGVGVSAGFKVDSVEAANGSASLSRFPVAGTLHALVPFADHWYFLVRGGVGSELDATLSGEGFAAGLAAELSTRPGPLAELGVYYFTGARAGLGFAVRYSPLEYSLAQVSLDASGVGFIGSVHYNF